MVEPIRIPTTCQVNEKRNDPVQYALVWSLPIMSLASSWYCHSRQWTLIPCLQRCHEYLLSQATFSPQRSLPPSETKRGSNPYLNAGTYSSSRDWLRNKERNVSDSDKDALHTKLSNHKILATQTCCQQGVVSIPQNWYYQSIVNSDRDNCIIINIRHGKEVVTARLARSTNRSTDT